MKSLHDMSDMRKEVNMHGSESLFILVDRMEIYYVFRKNNSIKRR